MRCAHCGAENTVFCGSCGRPLILPPAGSTPAPAPRSEPISPYRQVRVNNRGPSRLARFIGSFFIAVGILAAMLVAASTAVSVSRTRTTAEAIELYLEGAVELLILAVAFLALIAIILLYRKHSA
jgi:hypothetical protein